MEVKYGAVSPDGKFMVGMNSRIFYQLHIEDQFAARDALRAVQSSDPKPKTLNQSLAVDSKSLEGWKLTTLSLSGETKPGSRQIVDSMVWLENGKVGCLLMTDGTLIRIRFPELILEARLKVGPSRRLFATSEGLVVQSTAFQQLVLIDETSLTIKAHFPMDLAGTWQLSGSPKSSRIWLSKLQRSGNDKWFVVESFDLRTREAGRIHTNDEFNQMLASGLPKKGPFPTRLDGCRMLAVSPDNRYAFVSDGETLARFAIHGDRLAFQDALDPAARSPKGPIVISHDSALVALRGANQKSRDSHPVTRDGRAYGTYFFAINDFDRVVIYAALSHGGTIALSTHRRQAYAFHVLRSVGTFMIIDVSSMFFIDKCQRTDIGFSNAGTEFTTIATLTQPRRNCKLRQYG